MSEKIARSDKATAEFISQISHEAAHTADGNTRLGETLQYDPAIKDESARCEDNLQGGREADRHGRRSSGFTRIQDGRFNLRMELVDIAAELEDSLFTYGKLMSEAGIEVNYEPPEYDIPQYPAIPSA